MYVCEQLLEVNGLAMRGKSVHEVCQMLGALTGTLHVVLAPRARPRSRPPTPRVLHVRAHFDYDPEDDVYIPCRELGTSATLLLLFPTLLYHSRFIS
jgi:MAGUK p55 subfamily member 5